MRKKLVFCGMLLSLAIIPNLLGAAIEKITTIGNQKISRDTILFYMKSRELGPFSETILKDDFLSLWKTGFFETITLEVSDGSNGKIVKILLKENPLISSVSYKLGKKIKENDIVDQLQKYDIILSIFSYYNPAKVKKAEKIIKKMLIEKGYNHGNVNILTKLSKENNKDIELLVQVEPGARTRIGDVVFPGLDSKKVSARFLISGMKNNKPHSLLSLIEKKDVYSKEKIDEDLEGIKQRLLEKGFLEARIGNPTLSTVSMRNATGKIMKMMQISIPIEMGPQYNLGEVKIEGNKIFKTDVLYSLIKLKKGEIYNTKKRNKSVEVIQNLYGAFGHIFCQIAPVENLDPEKRIADLTLNISEGETAYVGKLEFTGNTFTKDHVIRREWLLREGSRFNANWLKTCVTRMRQLGLVDLEKEPEFKQNPDEPQKMDIIVPLKEISRQNVNFNVGYSGYDGWFFALGYSTKNFLGMGETLSANIQSGTRASQYNLSFTEPYLFNLADFGFSIYKTSVDYSGLYKRNGEGFSLSTATRFARFFGASLSYNFENVNTSEVSESLLYINPYYYRSGIISAITPTLYYSTVDSPLFPSSGTKYLFSYRFSGGILGGDVNLHKAKFQFLKFVPIWLKHTIAVQFVYQGIQPIGGESVPYYERIFLGGEQSIRGFDYYRLGPRNENGVVVGGGKAIQFNLEYMIPLNEQISASLFYDIGNAYDFGKPITLKNIYSSLGLEVKVYVPMLNVPFRLIFAYNPRLLEPEDSHFVFRFAVGPSFQ